MAGTVLFTTVHDADDHVTAFLPEGLHLTLEQVAVAVVPVADLHADEAASFAVVTGALAALVSGSIVPYVRARAEGVGYTASVGIAERADRLLIALILILATIFGASHWVMGIGLWILGGLALITVIQRMVFVYKQMKEASDA